MQEVKAAGKKLDKLVPPVQKVYKYNVTKFEDTDDEYHRRINNEKLYQKYTSNNERIDDNLADIKKHLGIAKEAALELGKGLLDTLGTNLHILS